MNQVQCSIEITCTVTEAVSPLPAMLTEKLNACYIMQAPSVPQPNKARPDITASLPWKERHNTRLIDRLISPPDGYL